MSDSNFFPPVACNLPKHAVQKLAENVATQLSFEPGNDLFDILKKLGGRYRYQNFSGLGETDSGSLFVHGEGNFEVIIATNTSVVRDRFTVAHEIGHYILHYIYNKRIGVNIPEKMSAARYGSERIEWEANWFAASFLMPIDKFKSSFIRNSGRIDQISEEFGVSYRAAQVRAESLSIP